MYQEGEIAVSGSCPNTAISFRAPVVLYGGDLSESLLPDEQDSCCGHNDMLALFIHQFQRILMHVDQDAM